jgi:hypothetical protein
MKMAYRLGWFLYWICLALGGALVLLLMTIDNFAVVRNLSWSTLAIVVIPALVVYGLGLSLPLRPFWGVTAMRRAILVAALLAVADAPRAHAACKADDPACFRR